MPPINTRYGGSKTDKMKATYNANAKTKFTSGHRKEGKTEFSQWAALIPKGLNGSHAVIDLRIYVTGQTVTACIWIHTDTLHTSGSGSARGGGYHKLSAAAEEAINNAGFTLSEEVGGVGNSAIEAALIAIAAEIGHPEAMIHHAHQ